MFHCEQQHDLFYLIGNFVFDQNKKRCLMGTQWCSFLEPFVDNRYPLE